MDSKVSICCITYNQAKFIRDAIEGFLFQKTDFPVEILIHDDASTDGTADIIREYQEQHPDLIKAVFQTENQYSQGKKVISILFNLAQGKYIALCEGDDYWTDPLKLQKQVDFMESHPECSICCHKVLVNYVNGQKTDYVFPSIDGDQVFNSEYLYEHAFVRTSSVLFWNNDIEAYSSFLKGFKVGDSPLFYFYAQKGYIGFLDRVMSVYRIHDSSMWSSQDAIVQVIGTLETRLLQRKKLRLKGSRGLNNVILGYILQVSKYYSKRGEKKLSGKFLLIGFYNFLYATKSQRNELIKLSIKTFLPKIYNYLY